MQTHAQYPSEEETGHKAEEKEDGKGYSGSFSPKQHIKRPAKEKCRKPEPKGVTRIVFHGMSISSFHCLASFPRTTTIVSEKSEYCHLCDLPEESE
jgi:hypothetical protein